MDIKTKLIEYGSLFGKRFISGFVACAMLMTWGNVFDLTASHITTAFETGAVAAILLMVFLSVYKNWDQDNKERMAIASGVSVAAADLMVHPSAFLSIWGEPIMTGLLAGVIAWTFSKAKKRFMWTL